MHRVQGSHDVAREHFDRALAACRTSEDLRGQARTLVGLGGVYPDGGDHEQAVEASLRAFELFRDLGDRFGEAVTLDYLGIAHERLGQYARGRPASPGAGTVTGNRQPRRSTARPGSPRPWATPARPSDCTTGARKIGPARPSRYSNQHRRPPTSTSGGGHQPAQSHRLGQDQLQNLLGVTEMR
ncbi:tetratricopeptide repeat protein [Nonomuraea guangzhouensis]|uniref:Tetratricopeptide repeat protein n=1 Tax=Nonomuraea guangzhouensis TaxID=1291555 RepID=A0ABW4GQS6_9ACTN